MAEGILVQFYTIAKKLIVQPSRQERLRNRDVPLTVLVVLKVLLLYCVTEVVFLDGIIAGFRVLPGDTIGLTTGYTGITVGRVLVRLMC